MALNTRKTRHDTPDTPGAFLSRLAALWSGGGGGGMVLSCAAVQGLDVLGYWKPGARDGQQ